jgi:hypothetical protein
MLPLSLDCPLLIAPLLKGQSTMDNSETLATLATQDEEKTEGAINNGQSRDTGNIGYTSPCPITWTFKLPVKLPI